MLAQSSCIQCGAKFPSGILNNRCPKCLLWSALEGSGDKSDASEDKKSFSAKIFGDFELLDEIAHGGMGVVYKARQISLNRIVAIKMILAGGLASQESIRRFQSEAETAANLLHPNIVSIHEVGECEGHHFFTMDYVEGPNLAELVKDQPLPAKRAAHYLKLIAEAVHYAHQHGILHRDLKPSNVLVDSFDQPRITDFGLSKRLSQNSDLTLSGQTVGSPNFIPPEQAEGKRNNSSPASDVYSLGALLYFLLTSRPPFQAESLTSVLKQVIEAEPIAPRLLNPNVPRDLETICLKCLEKEPGKRYPTAHALAEELERYLQDKPILSRPVGLVGKIWRWGQRQPVRAALAGALVCVVLLGLTGILWQWQRAEQQRINAQANELQSRQNAYAADISLAQRALEQNDLGLALDLLDNYRPKNPLLSDLRGWEWRYLWQQCQSDELSKLYQYTNMLGSLALSPDGRWLAVRQDNSIILWDMIHRKEMITWPYRGYKRAFAFSPNSRCLAIGCTSGGTVPIIRLIEIPTQNEIAQLPHRSEVGFLAFSPEGKLASYEFSGLIHIWDIERRQIIASNQVSLLSLITRAGYGADERRGTLAFSHDDNILAIGDAEGKILLWEWASNTLISNVIVEAGITQSKDVQDRTALQAELFNHAKEDLKDSGRQHSTSTPLQNKSEYRFKRQREIPAPGEYDGVTALAFSKDSTILAAGYGYSDTRVHLWDVKTLKDAGKLTGHKAWISTVAFTADDKFLISASGDQTIRIWDLSQYKEVKKLKGHTHEVLSAAFLPGSNLLISGSKDGSIRLWNMSTQSTNRSLLTLPEPVSWLRPSFSSDSQTLYTVIDRDGSMPGSVKSWDLMSLQEKRLFPELGSNNVCVTVSPDGHWLASGDTNGMVKIWSLNKGLLFTNFIASTRWIVGLFFDCTSRKLISCGWNRHDMDAAQWEVPSFRKLGSILHVPPPTALTSDVSSDFRWIAFGHVNGKVSVWDLFTGKEMVGFPGKTPAMVKGVQFIGNTLAAGGHDGVIRLWDLTTKRELATLRGQMSSVHSLAISPDGRRLVMGGAWPTEAVRLWDLATRKELLTLQGQGNLFLHVRFSPDGNTLIAMNGKMILHIWRAPSWTEIEAAESRMSMQK